MFEAYLHLRDEPAGKASYKEKGADGNSKAPARAKTFHEKLGLAKKTFHENLGLAKKTVHHVESVWLKGKPVQNNSKVVTNLSERQHDALKRHFMLDKHRPKYFFASDDFEDGVFTGNKSVMSRTPEPIEHEHVMIDHEYHEHEPSLVTAIAAGLINFILMFGFCCAYGIIMFSGGNYRHCAMGIKMSLCCATLMGSLLSTTSRVPIAIGGPDMNSVIFVGAFVEKISKELVKQYEFADDVASTSYNGGPGYDFCDDVHYYNHTVACDNYHEQLRATVLFAVTVSSFTVAVVFILLGFFKFTVYVSYVPTSIVDAFLSCMGYKVFKYGIKLCQHDPKKFLPAAALGVPMYFLKAMHIGNPLVTFSIFLMCPFALTYFLVAVQGYSIDDARKEKYLFAEIKNEDFWNIWEDGFFNREQINYKAWWATKFDLLTMVLVLILDVLVVAVRTTEAELPIKVSKNHEMQLFGVGNLVGAACSSPAGYMQLKFGLINFGIMQNARDRRSGYIYTVLCGIIFFTSVSFFNYMPRMFVSALLFFGASGFVAEHLWGSKDYLSYIEWGQVLVILLIFVLSDSLVWAVTVGCILCGLTFITKYANIPCIAGVPLRGGELNSHEQYPAMVYASLTHISNCWTLIIRLKGFVFFASVQSVTREIRNLMLDENEKALPPYRRVKFVLLDCQLLDGLDSSAEKDLQMMTRDASWHGIRILWASMDPEVSTGMQERGTILDHKDIFPDIDDALLYIENRCLEYRKAQQERWEKLHPAFALRSQLASLRDSFEPFANILRLDAERFGCPWDYCAPVKIRKNRTLLWSANEWNRELFLVHTGAVGIFQQIPGTKGQGQLAKPVAVYRHGWFLNREFLLRMPTKHYAVALEDGEVLCWSKHEWWRMHREQPHMANAILEAAMRQAGRDMERVARLLRSHATVSEEVRREMALDRGLRAGAEFSSVLGDDHHLPHDLENRLDSIQNAQSLEQFKLYDPLPPGESGFLPKLPPPVARDLEVAYHTYKHVEPDFPDIVYMPWNKVNEALMYAGIFDCLLVTENCRDHDLTQHEFMEVGHEAFFTRFSNLQIVKVYNVFKASRDDNEEIPRDKLHDVLRGSFMPNVSEQVVNGVAEIVEDGECCESIDAEEFVGVVSRLVRKHEQDWNILRACRAVLRKFRGGRVGATDVLTKGKLTDAASRFASDTLNEMDAAEMLWCNACYAKLLSANQQGLMLDFSGLVGALILQLDEPYGKLPPPPAKDMGHSLCTFKAFVDNVEQADERNSAHLLKFKRAMSITASSTFFPRGMSITASSSLFPSNAFASHPPKPSNAEDIDTDFGFGAKATSNPSSPTNKSVKIKVKKGNKSIVSRFSTASGSLYDENEPPPARLVSPLSPAVNAVIASKKEAARQQILTSAKGKLLRQVKDILRMGAQTAVVESNLCHGETEMYDLLLDLRNGCVSPTKAIAQYQTRLSKEDFEEARRKSEERKRIDNFYNNKSCIPNTPDVKLHILLDYPESSRAANLISLAMGAVILLSVLMMFVKSLTSPTGKKMSSEEEMYWKVGEASFTIIFLSELGLRFSVATALGNQTYAEFLMKPLNICDFISCLPYFLEVAVGSQEEAETTSLAFLKVARLLRLTRVMRIVRLASKSKKSIFGPVAVVLTIIWGIFLKEEDTTK